LLSVFAPTIGIALPSSNTPFHKLNLKLAVGAVDIGFVIGFTRRSLDVLEDTVTLHVGLTTYPLQLALQPWRPDK